MSIIAAEILLDLSNHLRTFFLRGVFAVNTVEWVPLIIGMLSRKLDTLNMNHWRGEMLNREDADRLILVSYYRSILQCLE